MAKIVDTSLSVASSLVPDLGHGYLKVTPVCVTKVISSSSIATCTYFLEAIWHLVDI